MAKKYNENSQILIISNVSATTKQIFTKQGTKFIQTVILYHHGNKNCKKMLREIGLIS
jgi:hypothetical protein